MLRVIVAQLSMSRMSSRLHRILRNEATVGAASSVMLTGMAAIASFGMLTALARSMSTADFGLLAGWMNALLFLSVVAVFGQETIFVRHWNEFVQQRQFGRARGLLLFGIAVSTLGAALVAVGIYVASPWLAASRELMVAVLLFLFAQTLCLFSSQTTRITAGLVSGVIHREITWRCMVLLGVAWFAYNGTPFTLLTFFYLAAGGLLLAVILQFRSTIASLPRRIIVSKPEIDVPSWLARSSRMWMAALLEASSQYLDVVVVAAILSSLDVANYFVCVRLAALFLMLNGAFALYSSRRISFLYHRGELRSLQLLLKQLSLLIFALVVSSLLFIEGAGDLLLGLFGPTYQVQHSILIVLCIGTATVALGGPATYLLLLTGHETAYIRTLALFTVFRYTLIGCSGLLFGLFGVVTASAVAMILLTFTLIFLCRKLVKVDPSILAFLGRAKTEDRLGLLRS
jgi:O-antigen/teichoic acid export membrane protein